MCGIAGDDDDRRHEATTQAQAQAQARMHKTTEDGSHRRAHAKVSYVYARVLSATAATQGNKATREGEWSCLETKGKFRALLVGVGLGLGLGLLGPALLSGWALAGAH